jgi:hypothetical protein
MNMPRRWRFERSGLANTKDSAQRAARRRSDHAARVGRELAQQQHLGRVARERELGKQHHIGACLARGAATVRTRVALDRVEPAMRGS